MISEFTGLGMGGPFIYKGFWFPAYNGAQTLFVQWEAFLEDIPTATSLGGTALFPSPFFFSFHRSFTNTKYHLLIVRYNSLALKPQF